MSTTRAIDAHHHLWDLQANYHEWLMHPIDHFAGDYAFIRRDYLVSEYLADIASTPVAKSVHVQAGADPRDPVRETAWLQSVADTPSSRGFPHAIVAHADLEDPEVEGTLAAHRRHRNVRGIRQMLNYASDAPRLCVAPRGDLMSSPAWRRGYGLLAKYELSFDMQVWAWQLEEAAKLASDFPNVVMVVNHCGMPLRRDRSALAVWRRGLDSLAAQPNVFVKISGLGMFDRAWTPESIRPYVYEVLERCGTARCMFGSNFPVDKLFSSYESLWSAYETLMTEASCDERDAMFYSTAARCYRLGPS